MVAGRNFQCSALLAAFATFSRSGGIPASGRSSCCFITAIFNSIQGFAAQEIRTACILGVFLVLLALVQTFGTITPGRGQKMVTFMQAYYRFLDPPDCSGRSCMAAVFHPCF